jgi:hypothetical protein
MHACVVKTLNAEQDALKKQADEYAVKLKTWMASEVRRF